MKLPTYHPSLFSKSALADPFEHYRAIRDLGPLVNIKRPDLPVLSRYQDVKNALKASDVLLSGQGISLNFISNLIGRFGEKTAPNSDGEQHKKYRSQLLAPLRPAELEKLRPNFESMISEQVGRYVGQGTFDAAAELSSFLPVNVVSMLVGIPEEGRRNIMTWAEASFDTVGPIRKGYFGQLKTMYQGRLFFHELRPESLVPEGWAAQLYDSVEKGVITLNEAGQVILGLALPSLDTTILAANNLLVELAKNPDEWHKIKADPSLIDSAVHEALRHGATLRWFTRKAGEDYQAGDVFLKKGQRVLVMYGSANRDERQYADPDNFIVDRNPRDHLALGHGAHSCIGQHLARMEIKALLMALVERVNQIQIDTPEPYLNSALFGYRKIPMRLS